MAGIDLNNPATLAGLNATEFENLEVAIDAARNYTAAYWKKSKSSTKDHELGMEIESLTQKLGILEAARVRARGEVAAADAIMGPSLATVIAQDKIIALNAGDIGNISMVVAGGFKGTIIANRPNTVPIQTELAAIGISSELSLE